MIQTYSTTIRRKEMDAVLTCMVDEKIGPGEMNAKLIQQIKEFIKCDGAVALRSPAIALKYALQTISLDESSKIMISALAPAWQYQTIEIGTGSTSFAQLYLYQKCGFRVVNIDRDFFVDNYDDPIIENKLILRDMIRLEKKINSISREVVEKNLAEAVKDIPVEHLESQKDVDAWLKKHPEDDE